MYSGHCACSLYSVLWYNFSYHSSPHLAGKFKNKLLWLLQVWIGFWAASGLDLVVVWFGVSITIRSRKMVPFPVKNK